MISHGPEDGYPDGYTRVYSKLYITQGNKEEEEEDDDDEECGEAGVWALEDDKKLASMQGVKNIHDLRRLGGDDYCLLTRDHDSLDEYECDWEGGPVNTFSDLFFPPVYLELWKNDTCVRTLRTKGLQFALLNEYCVVALFQTSLFSPVRLVRYSLEKFAAGDEIRSMDLESIGSLRMDENPHCLLLTKNQIMWSLPLNDSFLIDDENNNNETDFEDLFCGDDENEHFCINSLNFWYAPHYQALHKKYPMANYMCTFEG